MDVKVLASGSTGNCYVIFDSNDKLLIECGIKFDRILRELDYDLSGICGCLVSHSHKDHSLSCSEVSAAGIEVFTGLETSLKIADKRFLTSVISAGKQLQIGSFLVLPFDCVHCDTNGEKCQCLGFVIYSTVTKERLLFATDTAYIESRFKGLNYIMLEVNYIDEMINGEGVPEVEKRRFKSHMSLETALDFLRANDLSQVKKIYAMHLSKKMCNDKKVLQILRRETGKEVIICKTT